MGKFGGGVDEEVDIFKPTEILRPLIDPEELLAEMLQVGWRDSKSWQADLITRMHQGWEGFSAAQRVTAFENSQAHVTRLSITVGDAARWTLFNDIMRLQNDVSVRRALSWNPSRWAPYQPEKWEEPYLNLPGFIGRFVNCYKESSVPAPFFAWSGIALLSACCKYNVYIQVGGEELLLNLFTFFVGDSAVGKSYAKNCAVSIIKLLNDQLDLVVPRSPDALGPGLAMVWHRPDLHINMLSQDGTYESNIDRLSKIRQIPMKQEIRNSHTNEIEGLTLSQRGLFADAAAVLMIDEVSEHFGRSDWAADKKIAGYTSMFSSKERSKSTLGRGEQAYDNQAFSMIVCGAVEWFKGAVSPAMMHGGFMDRAMFLYRTSTRRIYTAFDMPIIDPIKEMYLAEDLHALVTPPVSGLRRPVDISAPAKRRLSDISTAEFQREIDIRDHKLSAGDDYKKSAVRREHAKIKIGSLLTISESIGPGKKLVIEPINIDHINLADALITAEDKHFNKFLDAVNLTGATEFTRWIFERFVKAKWQPITTRSLLAAASKKAVFHVHTKGDLLQRMDLLFQGGVISPIMVGKGSKHRTGKGTEAWSSDDDGRWVAYL